MKKLVIIALLGLTALLSGCTYTETPSERNRRIIGITNMNARGIIEDWDTIWLYDRNSYATQWHPWIGI
jgi:hypothetical protein